MNNMTNKEKFLKLVSGNDDSTLKQIKERIKNKAMLKESQKIAIKVLAKLDELDWSQKKLADEMKVSPQQVHKIVSGKENLTIETQVKLQEILDIPVLASYYENKFKEIESELSFEISLDFDKIITNNQPVVYDNKEVNSFNHVLQYDKVLNEYSHQRKAI
jgi:transcriptional regulator with XRE-family HTH domain